MSVIYMIHPTHGVKVAINNREAEYDETLGWRRYDLATGAISPAPGGDVALAAEDFAAIGATGEAAPATDTASAGLNGRLQRIAQRLTASLITPLLAATSTPVVASTSVTVNSATFTPNLGRPINILLSGTWTGSVALQRSIDAGVTWQGVTINGVAWAVFTANCDEPVWEPTESGGVFRLAITRTTGTIDYRIAQ